MSETENLITFLRDRDEPCPLCRYNLRNNPGHICPECGARLSLALKGAHALDVIWHAVIAFFAIVGSLMLLLGVVILQGLLRGDELSARPGPGIAFVALAFLGPIAGLGVVFMRRWFLRDTKGHVLLVALPITYLLALCLLLYSL